MSRVLGREILSDEQLRIAESNGIGYHTLYSRINTYGMSADEAINTPLKKKHRLRGFAERMRDSGINIHTIRQRVQRGDTIDEALSKPTRQYLRKVQHG